MLRSLLPAFDAANAIRENVRIDKICIEFPHHRIQSYAPHRDNDHFGAFYSLMASRRNNASDYGEDYRLLFAPYSINRDTSQSLAIRFNSGFLLSGSPAYFNF